MESNESKADDRGMQPSRPMGSDATAGHNWFGRRKRIVAREVSRAAAAVSGDEDDAVAAVEREMRSAALGVLKPADVIDLPPALEGRPPESVIDPTLLGERHRKHSQNVAYRLTQAAVALTVVASLGAILAALLEDAVLAQVLSATACVVAVLGVRLVRGSRLAYRLRGYAAAAGALAVIALVVSVLPQFLHDEPRQAPQVKSQSTPGGQP
jgi:hypothetical protein